MSYDCCRLEEPPVELKFLKTPIGWLRIEGDKEFVREITFRDRGGRSKSTGSSAVSQAEDELRQYFGGERIEFDFPFLMSGTLFQNLVWGELLKVGFGKTSSYVDIAKAIGKKTAYRAVGMANHMNRLPIVIPCHRVIAKSGKLQGYAGGLSRKQWLLDHEASLLFTSGEDCDSLGRKYGGFD